MKLKQYEKSLENSQKAGNKDTHFIATYVQMAAIYLEYNIYDAAIKCYEVAIHLMGNKKYINYQPPGLNLILYLTEALHNYAVAESKADNWKQVEILINMAIRAQQEDKFNNKLKISLQAVQQKQLQQFDIGTRIFHPPKWMIESTKNVDYLGDSKVISTNKNPFSMNETNSRSKSANDELWPNLKEQEAGQKKQMKTMIELLTTITLDTAMETIDKAKQIESNLGTDGKPQQPPRPQSKSPPI
ncbi:neutrophil cytosol factor 2-like [Octopus bimaculoides]|uniref:neutrophil cytosol factor 2-like n=1 Tax=Octopus bimaculoides TaxID=37653 RepID=UPI00071E4582|nr:neutrophil cytosol factor 2-like [Octopus bimaculoides]|eukprot:XP_014781874.1 PREDICTED: neutrophil cytosol factor 2-like [Octopus bimaculoides]